MAMYSDDYIAGHNWGYNEPKGDPYLRPVNSKGKMKVGGVIPRGGGYPIWTCEAGTEQEVHEKIRRELARRKSVPAPAGYIIPTSSDLEDLQMILRLKKEALHPFSVLECYRDGLHLRTTIHKENLMNNVLEDGFTIGRKQNVRLGEFLDTALTKIPVPKRTPMRRKNEQKTAIAVVARELCADLGETIKVIDLLKDPKPLEDWLHEKVTSESSGQSLSYRAFKRRAAMRLFTIGCQIFWMPSFPFYIFGCKPCGVRSATHAPPPKALKKMLRSIRKDHPELLLYTLFQVFFALRPEEAFRALDNPWEFLKKFRLHFPQHLAKTGVVCDRNVRIRPVAAAWLSEVPGLLDRSKKDFHAYGPNGGIIRCDALQTQIYQILRASGFNPSVMPDEAFRKSQLSASIACGVDPKLVAQEASHANLYTLWRHYDAKWEFEDGVEFWSMFPTDDPHTYTEEELYAAFKATDRH